MSARRVGIWWAVVALAALGWWLGRGGRPVDEGLVVEVVVTDRAGHAVAGAQARPRWSEAPWTDGGRLVRVPLAEGRAVDEDAVAEAVDVRAPFYAEVSGDRPEVTRLGPQHFRAHFQLEQHGVLELVVPASLIGAARAHLEPDEPLRRIEAIGGRSVARVNQPAAFRIRAGLETVTIVLEGEPTAFGTREVARRRLTVPAPAPGRLQRAEVEAGKAHPVHGRVAWPDDLADDQRTGEVRVTEVARDGTRTPWGSVPVGAAGGFVLADAGAEAYELVLQAPFVQPLDPLLVGGGGTAVFDELVERPWLHLQHDALPGVSRPVHLTLRDAEDRVVAAAGPPLQSPGACRLPLVAARGDLEATLVVPGDADTAPQGARWALGAIAPRGPTPVRVPLAVTPHGTLSIRSAGPAPRGGTVRIAGPHGPWSTVRALTWLPTTEPAPLEVAGLPAGRFEVWVRWGEGDEAVEVHDAVVEAERTVDLAVAHEPGGRLALDEAFGPDDARDRRLHVTASPYDVAFEVPLARRARGRGWEADVPLKPGAYRGRLHVVGQEAPDGEVAFTLVAGEQVRVPRAALTAPGDAPPR
jgi:hypothetical protein